MSGRAKDGIDVSLLYHAEKMAPNIYRATPNALFPLIVFPILSVARWLQAIVPDE